METEESLSEDYVEVNPATIELDTGMTMLFPSFIFQ